MRRIELTPLINPPSMGLMRLVSGCLLEPCVFVLALTLANIAVCEDWIWVEGEKPVYETMNRHPWYDQVQREEFSGGDFISNFHKDRAGEAEYRFEALRAGDYEFWIRANPLMAKMDYSINGSSLMAIDMGAHKVGQVNVAADQKPDLRFLAWMKVGKVPLRQGPNTLRFGMRSENSHHGYLDCFLLTLGTFQPKGALKPGEKVLASASDSPGWLVFDPAPDTFAECPMDLRSLNEKFAGEHGFIDSRQGQFIHSRTGEPVRFWAVNGPPHDLKGDRLRQCARMLAKRGVNLVRVHGGYFDEKGEVKPDKVGHAMEIVEAMKHEGIYTLFSIYFPLWFQPRSDSAFLQGYDGKKHPFAALFFNPAFQAQYRKWWTALLTSPNRATGKTLLEEPAVAALEIQNEDSLFFWTFSEDNLPDLQLRILEAMFAEWLVKRYGSLTAALAQWKQLQLKRDAPEEGRMGFRPIWNMLKDKTPRDQDTARFLLEIQTRFYAETYSFLRKLGFKGRITASNWTTASPEFFGPLEKLSYTTGDFIDRHGYFGCNHKGDSAAWSVRNGHTYSDRSALRFESEEPGKPRLFVHPVMDIQYDDKPSMISETTWNRPNRFRSEAPLYYAAYGALQESDGIVHFALDGSDWLVKPGFWMQPWTLMSPAMMGQFPAAVLVYRRGYLAAGEVLARIQLNKEELLYLEGTPLPQEAALDELRLKDLPVGTEVKPGGRIDPLLCYAGRAEVQFVSSRRRVDLGDLRPFIDHEAQVVTSNTRELRLDYGRGVLTIDSRRAQGVSGSLKSIGPAETKDLFITSEMELGHIIAVSMDGRPLNTSARILLQVMSEEKPSGFLTETAGEGVKRITSIGTDPWLMKEMQGTVRFKRPDASRLSVTALDLNGYPAKELGTAERIQLRPDTLYYLVQGVSR